MRTETASAAHPIAEALLCALEFFAETFLGAGLVLGVSTAPALRVVPAARDAQFTRALAEQSAGGRAGSRKGRAVAASPRAARR